MRKFVIFWYMMWLADFTARGGPRRLMWENSHNREAGNTLRLARTTALELRFKGSFSPLSPECTSVACWANKNFDVLLAAMDNWL